MSNRDLAIATIFGFLVLPSVVCVIRAFGPRRFNAWMALSVDATLGALLYAGAAFYHSENNLDYLRARSENPWLEFPPPELHDFLFAVLGGFPFALIYYAPFALVYYAWEQSRREKPSKPNTTARKS